MTTDASGGDASRALNTLLTDNSQPVRRDNKTRVGNPDRFAGKSREEILDMYANLETHSGRLANQLGTTQTQLTEALSIAKRQSDISGQEPATRPSTVDVNGVDLLANPKPVLERLIDERIAGVRKESHQRISQLETQLARVTYQTNHKNADWNDPHLVAFVQATPLRQSLNQRAQQGDFIAADALLTEYDQFRRLSGKGAEDGDTPNVTTVTLESGNSGGDENDKGQPTGKIYSRADIMALRNSDPDRYYSDEVQQSLMRAYRENRVR